MDKKNPKNNEKEKPTWDWTHVECYLKTIEHSRKSTIWNLAPSIILTNPSSDSAGPNVRLYIDTEKALQYSNELGWNWHKSWNIPNISLRLEIKDDDSGDFLLSPRNLFAQIFAVKKNTENEKGDRMTLIDVGIRGQSKMEMIDGQVYFSAIKFSSTTYNNEGINFNLLIVLYINEGQFQKPKVLTAVISPPIFVDSRRSARDYQQKKFSAFVQPFAYDSLDKEFVKRENKSKSQTQIIIKNDPEGFYNYITAPNIRHKVKHPIFLAIKFSSCVRIYYNKKLVQFSDVKDAIESLQSKMLKQTRYKQKNDPEISGNLQQKSFLFMISNLTDSLKRKKVLESIQNMQNQFIGITCAQTPLECFECMGTIQALKKGYKDAYENLVAICQNYQPEDQDQSVYDDQSYPDESSQKSSKKVKREAFEPARTNPIRTKTSIITNSKQAIQKPKEKQQEVKKQQLFQSQFDAPAFFAQPQEELPKVNSAFTKRIGFKNVNQNPEFDASELYKAFSNNLGNQEQNKLPSFLDPKPAQKIQENINISQANSRQGFIQGASQGFTQGSSQRLPQSASQGFTQSANQRKPTATNIGAFSTNGIVNMGAMGMGGNYNSSVYDNLMYSNLMLSNWLGTIKNNNNTLYDNMGNNNIGDQLLHKSHLQRYQQAQQQQKMLEMSRIPLQNQQQQSAISLIQQIGLYKELLSQVTYQNQLLSRDISMRQNLPMNQPISHVHYQPQDHYQSLHNMQNSMGSIGLYNGINPTMQGFMGAQSMPMQSKSMQGVSASALGSTSGPKNFSEQPQRYSGSMIGSQVQNITLNSSKAPPRAAEKQPQAKQAASVQSVQMNQRMAIGGNMPMMGVMGMGMMRNFGMVGMPNDYDLIRSMVLEDLKKEAQNKEKTNKNE